MMISLCTYMYEHTMGTIIPVRFDNLNTFYGFPKIATKTAEF